MSEHEYLLGDSRRQSKLWDPTAHAPFDRIGIKEGWRVLEIGPGQGSLNRELQRRVNGPVDAVELFERVGLEVIDITPTIKSGTRDSEVWRWLTSYFFSVMDRYAKIRPFTPAQAKRLTKHWEEDAKLLIAPAVLDVVGRRT